MNLIDIGAIEPTDRPLTKDEKIALMSAQNRKERRRIKKKYGIMLRGTNIPK